MLAALLLAVMSYSNLFAGTAVGFVVSALFVVSAASPAISAAQARPFLQRLTGESALGECRSPACMTAMAATGGERYDR